LLVVGAGKFGIHFVHQYFTGAGYGQGLYVAAYGAVIGATKGAVHVKHRLAVFLDDVAVQAGNLHRAVKSFPRVFLVI